ncbi:MAG: hypothetical protein IPO32_04465 [Crocinitomicaceae bacterium]|jgi:hypothetical protein|nr:hypothetical protein [Crocinitomicaceae bacterium]MBK6951798.1 hypothetical protein [Crocinitomicaceae bacterium]MBK9590780.1 hypothetical protein [Crocinitomicaceae bacterium]
MSQVSHESIDKALDRIDSLSDEALDQLIETYTLSQQDLVDYIMSAGAEYENEDLNIYAIYYFAIIYEAFLQQGLTPKKITEAEVDEFQEPFLEALDAIHKDENHQPLQELISQFPLQEFMVSEIEATDEDGEELDEETKTQLFIVTAAVIGLLNESVS